MNLKKNNNQFKNNSNGIRYKCLNCPNYDLCGSCHTKGIHSIHELQQNFDAIGKHYNNIKAFVTFPAPQSKLSRLKVPNFIG